jgi:hypothetical protein
VQRSECPYGSGRDPIYRVSTVVEGVEEIGEDKGDKEAGNKMKILTRQLPGIFA